MIKLTRTFQNQLVIGETEETSDTVVIKTPYNVMPGMEGLQLFPMDFEIVGEEIDEISINKINILYSTKVGEELEDAYKQTQSAILGADKLDIITG